MDVLIVLMKILLWIISRTLKLTWFLIRILTKRGRGNRKGHPHGSARWATRWEQWRKGALSGDGVILGRGAFGRFIRFSKDGLVMVFAATGAGKGLGIVIPSLLSYRGSMVVTDPKGENYAITRRHRAGLGTVRMLNPSDLPHSDRYNPMDIIRKDTPSETDDAAALASLMVKSDARESHWDDKATSLLKALILHTLHEPAASRNLSTVRRLSVGTPEVFLGTLTEIANESLSLAAREIAAGFLTSSTGKDGTFSPEFSSILSNAQKATEPWSAGAPAGQLSQYSTFKLANLTTSVKTLYLCLEEDVLEVYGPWLRVMVGCILKTFTRAKANRPRHKVVLLLDEVAVLGRLETLEAQSGLLRAYCTPVLIWQNMPQMRKVYGEEAKAFLANASARVFFGISDNDTAQYVSIMVGHTTTMSTSTGISHSGETWSQENRQHGQPESGYWLIDAAEVQRLPVTRTIVKLRNVPSSILGRRIDYRREGRWRGLWDRWDGSPPHGMHVPPSPPHDRQE